MRLSVPMGSDTFICELRHFRGMQGKPHPGLLWRQLIPRDRPSSRSATSTVTSRFAPTDYEAGSPTPLTCRNS